MGFGAAARRAQDPELPLGRRVLALHHCLERFGPFGFHQTRSVLRTATGADERWDDTSITAAMGLLLGARRTWLEHVERYAAERLAAKRQGSRRPQQSQHAERLAWLDAHFVGEVARAWTIDGLGACTACDHPVTHHWSRWCCECDRGRAGCEPDPWLS